MKSKEEAEIIKRALAIVAKTKNAYSYDNYGEKGWNECALVLVRAGCTDEETEAILRSKIMRWAADTSENEYGKNDGNTLEEYFAGEDILDAVREEILRWGVCRPKKIEYIQSKKNSSAPPDMIAAIKATLAVWAPCVDDPNYAAQSAAQDALVAALKKAGVSP